MAPVAAQAASRHDLGLIAKAQTLAAGNGETLLAVWYPQEGGSLALIADRGGAGAPAPDTASHPSTQHNSDGVVSRLPYFAGSRRLGELVLVAHERDINSRLVRNIEAAAALALIAILVSSAFAKFVARRALQPLKALDSAINRAGATRDFTGRVEVTSRDEFGRLSQNFNALLGALEAYDSRLTNTLRDLTAAKEAAEEANRVKSRFLANMSHEIRTPLNGVLGMAHLMALGHLAKEQRNRLGVIQKSGEALLPILDDILDLAKMEAGGVELEDVAFDAAQVSQSACAAFASAAHAKGLAFSLEVTPEAAGQWQGDPTRVRQMIHNLVSNALKFTQQGEVSVRVETADRDGRKGLVITVADTGMGIAADVLPTLFEKFVQADNTSTRIYGGAGLGLAICKHVANLMGGSIDVHSELGEGATFRAILPLVSLGHSNANDASEGDPDEGCLDLSLMRVLVADDNATNRTVLKTILNAVGVAPIVVENGRQAVEAWAAEPFDLVLMDIQMPVLDGVSATREIRALERDQGRPATPVVAVTANAMDHQVREYLAAGLDAVLTKPIVMDRLYDTLADIAIHGRPQTAQAA